MNFLSVWGPGGQSWPTYIFGCLFLSNLYITAKGF